MTESVHQTYEHQAVVSGSHEYYNVSDDQNLRSDELIEEYTEKAAPPPKQKFYKKKRYWIICSIITVIVTVVAVVLALYVIFPKVAQSIMNKSKIDVTAAGISFNKPDSLTNTVYAKRDGDDMNSTFYMNMESSLSHTGPFSAKIKFHNPVQVYYNETYLGDMFIFNETKVAGGHGSLNAVTPFLIRDQAAFATFAKTMLAVDEFKWTLKGQLDITALTRTATVNLNKEIVLNGMNGFPNVKISSFNLPGDDPAGGISVELGTILESPSPIGVQLGTITLAIGYDGVPLGIVSGTGVNLAKGENNILLKGRLAPQNDTASLEKIGTLFSNYVAGKVSNTTAVGLTCAPDGVNPISWLSEGFKTVNLNVGLKAAAPLKIINGVSMGYLDLKFDSATPYSPIANAPAVTANFQMPFGFSLNVTEVSQNITLAINTTGEQTESFAVMQTPFVHAVSNQQDGTIIFGLNNTAIAGIPGKEATYNQYTYALTANNNYTFMISGLATTKANTPIGPITLGGINFTVPTTLHGLQFLNSTPTVINSLDVTGGTEAGLTLVINVTMDNPSDFSITTGDVSFEMGASGTKLGLVTLSKLTLNRGSNTVSAISSFDPKSSDVGQNILSTFVMGSDNTVDIGGYAESTDIASLAKALSAVSLTSTLPGLTTALIQGASMSVLPDTLQTGMVGVAVTISNPFTASLSISKVVSSATFQGMPIGNIDQDISSNPFVINGKALGTSQKLLMSMNIDPAAVALLLRNLAVASNMDTRALDGLLQLGGLSIEGQESVQADSSLFAGFNISQYVQDAMKALSVDLSLSSTITIGQYVNDLAFSQSNVVVTTDDTVTQLIPIVGQPIVQQIVDGSVLSFSTIVLSDVTEGSFKVQMSGSIANAGPMDATISFPSPLTIAWEGKTLGTVSMATINSKADVGATFTVEGSFTVANGDDMAAFSAYLINNESFEWEITTNDVSVSALGYTFTGVSLHKYVTLKGSNGFKDAVTITSFDLPSNDPAGGITLIANTIINNPGQVGFNLGGAAFESYFGDILLGPLASNGAANFAPQSSSAITMKGRLIPQTTKEGIVAITTVFGHYLAGQSTTLTVKGVSGSGSNGAVSWLSAAFKTISIENVILPGPATVPTLIPSIEMKDLTLDFTKDQWAPSTSSSKVVAQLKNPFGFPLGVSQLDMDVSATYGGGVVATLDVPTSPASTDASGFVTTSFSNIPFKVANHELFTGFNKLLTLSPSVTFGLKGTSNAIADTAVGTLSLPGVSFDVDTTLAGFNSFGGTAQIQSLEVTGAAAGYIIVSLVVQLNNPSNITISIGDVNFDVIMNEYNAVVGKAYMKDLTILPGAQNYNSEMHLAEGATSIEAVGKMLYYYLTGAPVPLTISGSSSSTSIAPIQQGLSELKLSTSINGITDSLIKQIDVTGDAMAMLTTGAANAVITLYNPLNTPFSIKHIKASTSKYLTCPVAGQYQNTDYVVGTIDYELSPPLTIGPKETVQTAPLPVLINNFENAPLLIATFADFNYYYNVSQTASVVVGNAFSTDQMVYTQKNAPFTINVPGITDQGDDLLTLLCQTSAYATSLALNSTNATIPIDNNNTTSTITPTISDIPTSTIITPTPTTDATAPTVIVTNTPTTTDQAVPNTTTTNNGAEPTNDTPVEGGEDSSQPSPPADGGGDSSQPTPPTDEPIREPTE
ncbi:hypothetical protein BDF20DRAFT_1000640 [Mycotypha africana]|uniref:uncharacterized protein n=1 Tax=Mycotypha africana TaxID=64632 RepID=UPI002301094D|nr:uncharacterized protein BDF20DRAFT_1000640 [Mycotypha africana]KAI8979283.1 hypothetical protein BDF20DRAFT_1000640 [Mycotypha africana]